MDAEGVSVDEAETHPECQINPNEDGVEHSSVVPAVVTAPSKGGDEVLHECFLCGKLFQSNRSVNRHLLNIHKEPSPILAKSRPPLSCSLCVYSTAKLHLLNDHLQKHHQMSVEDQHETFISEADFEVWKRSVERDTLSHFVKKSGDKRRGGSVICYFYCHRSGHFTSKSKGKRNLKGLGTNKINGFCPARIKLTKGPGASPLLVQYTSTHLGHTCDVGRLRLSNEEKVNIARKLALKVPIDVILDGVRDSVDIGMSRLQLLSRHDVLNIKQTFKLKSAGRPESGAWSSVGGWVRTMIDAAAASNNHHHHHQHHHLNYCGGVVGATDSQTTCQSAVVFYKPHDELHHQYPKLRQEDFLLVLMNNTQRDALLSHGSRLVIADSFDNFDAFNFELTALLVLDGAGEALPVSFIVSSRKDEAGLSVAFESIREALGAAASSFHAGTFMSDNVHTLYNAWCGVFGQAERRLLCPWHVDRVWRKRLTRTVGLRGNELQVEVYKTLRCLLMESDRLTFDAMLQSSLGTLLEHEATKQFGAYFRKEWAKRPEAWAQSYQDWPDAAGYDGAVNAHKTLNYILFLEEERDKEPDRLLHVIMAFARDRLLDRCDRQTDAATTSSAVDRIHERHRQTAYLSPESVSAVVGEEEDGRGSWNVTSADDTFRVRRGNQECSPQCPLTCKYCAACVHAFTCTCPDNSIEWNMCSHIHLVCGTLLPPPPPVLDRVVELHHHHLLQQQVDNVEAVSASHVVEYDQHAFEHWVTSHDAIVSDDVQHQDQLVVVAPPSLLKRDDANVGSSSLKADQEPSRLEESKYRYKSVLLALVERGDSCVDHEEYERLRAMLLPVIAEFDDYRKNRQQSTFDILVKETLQF